MEKEIDYSQFETIETPGKEVHLSEKEAENTEQKKNAHEYLTKEDIELLLGKNRGKIVNGPLDRIYSISKGKITTTKPIYADAKGKIVETRRTIKSRRAIEKKYNPISICHKG